MSVRAFQSLPLPASKDYWTSKVGGCHRPTDPPGRGLAIVDLWQNNLDTPGRQGPAHGYNNSCTGGNKTVMRTGGTISGNISSTATEILD